MAWIDAETGQPASHEDLAQMQSAPTVRMGGEAVTLGGKRAIGPSPQQGVEQVKSFSGATGLLADQFGQGAMAAAKRTYLGLKQAATYLTGDSAARKAVNDEIAAMEQQYGPALASPAGKVGNAVGTAAHFLLPGMHGATVGKAALAAGAYGAAQPTDTGNTDTTDYLIQKGVRTAADAALGAGASWLASRLTRPGPEIQPTLKGIEKEAEAYGLKGKASLTPAQRTQDRYLLQKEEGLLASPGSSNIIAGRRKAQGDVLDEAVSAAMGYPGRKPTEAVFGAARDNANLAYDPIAKIPKLNTDVELFDGLASIAKQSKAQEVVRVVRQLQKNGSLPGDAFLEHLQDIRTLAADSGRAGQQYTAKQFHKVADAMEDFLERKLTQEAKKPGNFITADTLKEFQAARTDLAAIHALEKSTDPVRGTVNPNKVLKEQFRRQRPGSTPSPTSQKIEDVVNLARVLHKTAPYIGSSGTAERLGGQAIVEAEKSPMSAMTFGLNSLANRALANRYLNASGNPGILNTPYPAFNNAIRRMLPPMAIGAAEGATD